LLLILKMSSTFFWDCRRVTESKVTDDSRQHSDVTFKGGKPWKNGRTYETIALSRSVGHHLPIDEVPNRDAQRRRQHCHLEICF